MGSLIYSWFSQTRLFWWLMWPKIGVGTFRSDELLAQRISLKILLVQRKLIIGLCCVRASRRHSRALQIVFCGTSHPPRSSIRSMYRTLFRGPSLPWSFPLWKALIPLKIKNFFGSYSRTSFPRALRWQSITTQAMACSLFVQSRSLGPTLSSPVLLHSSCEDDTIFSLLGPTS